MTRSAIRSWNKKQGGCFSFSKTEPLPTECIIFPGHMGKLGLFPLIWRLLQPLNCWMSGKQCQPWSHYENMPIQIYWKVYHQKDENLQIKNYDNFHISAQNIDCGYSLEPPRRGGSNEYPQSMFLSTNKKNNVYPCKPQFYHIKVGFKGVKIIKACFRDEMPRSAASDLGLHRLLRSVRSNALYRYGIICNTR